MSHNSIPFEATRSDLIEVCHARRPADLYVRGGHVVNVYSGEILDTNIAVYRDRIAYVGASEAAIGDHTTIIDATGRWVVPGFIEPHSHPWVLYNPISLTEKVLPLGTTTMVHDNLFFYLHLGPNGFVRMVKALRGTLPGLHLWLARIVSQSEYDGEKRDFRSDLVRELLTDLWDVVGTAEVTRWPAVYNGDPCVIDAIEFAKSIGKVSDGHTSGCSYERLNAIAAAGISACHEGITPQEVIDRLRLGLWTMLRNSSVRPDLAEVIRAVTEHAVDTRRLTLTCDGPNPDFIDSEGFVDGLLRTAVREGVNPIQALQMVTLNAATYLGLDHCIGGLAPGRRADIVLLRDLERFEAETVISAGRVVARDGRLVCSLPDIDWLSFEQRKPLWVNEFVLSDPRLYQFPAELRQEELNVPVIRFKLAVITERRDVTLPVREGSVDLWDHESLIYGALIDREGHWVAHAILDNFLPGVEGLASTYNTTTHILALGRDPRAMAQAACEVRKMGGGIVLVERGQVVLAIPLPFTGMMTTSPSFDVALEHFRALNDAVRKRGYPFHDILYSLLFLTCDFLPGLRLTPRGLLDVKQGAILVGTRTLDRSRRV